MADWDDYLFGILTGGLYNIGKAAYKAGEAVEEAGEAAEQAGIALAIIGSTVETVGKQLDSLLEEMEELITINRLTPRDESDLWEEEKERLDDLRQEKARLEGELASLGVTEPGEFNFDFWDFFTNLEDYLKKFRLIGKLVVVNNEIHEILYQEPGVVTTAIYNTKEVLERFNTIEQPKIEDILDSLDDNLEVTEETIKEIKKLFVTKKKVPVLDSELSKDLKDKLQLLELDIKYYQNLIDRNSTISSQLMSAMDKIPPAKFEITEKGVKIAGLGVSTAVSNRTGTTTESNLSDINVRESKGLSEKFNTGAKTGTDSSRKGIDSDVKKNRTYKYTTDIPGSKIGSEKRDVGTINPLMFALAKKPGYSRGIIQPQGAKISAALNTKFDGFQRNYAFYRAQTAFYERELIKIGRRIDKIKYRWEEEPGVIPRTLEELKGILERVRTQEQPRVDTILDTLNGNLEESKETLSKINESLDSAQGALSFFNKHAGMIKIGLGIFGAVVFLDFLVGLIVLVRMALGI